MSSKGKSQIEQREMRGKIIAYLERNRGKKQYRHAPSAGWAAGKVMRPLANKFGPGSNALKNHWERIVGEKWAKLSQPESIRGNKYNKTLYITAKGPAASLISADSANIIRKVNQFLGQRAIFKIKVTHGQIAASPKKPAAQKTDNSVQTAIETNEEYGLKQALEKLGQKISAPK